MEAETKNVYSYPPNTPGSNAETFVHYFHNLNESATETLEVVQRWVIDNQIEVSALNRNSLHPSLTLLRYLRANGFQVTA
jgi:hypothetical protein